MKTLSDKRVQAEDVSPGYSVFFAEDVKDFINELKEEFRFNVSVSKFIDERAGERLT